MFWRLLELCPTPEAAIAADTAAIRDIIAPLGLHNKRAVAVQRLSDDFLHKEVSVAVPWLHHNNNALIMITIIS